MKAKDLQDEIKASMEKIWLAGLGAFAAAEEEGSKAFKTLVERGEAFEKKSKVKIDSLRQKMGNGKVKGKVSDAKGKIEDMWDKVEVRINDSVAKTLGTLGIPTRDEISQLTKRVEELTASIQSLQPEKAESKPAAKSTRKTTTKTSDTAD